jgi:hypothetical protein
MNKLIFALVVCGFCNGAIAQDPSVVCTQQLGEDGRFESLFKKAPLDISKGQSLEVLANQSKATAKEKIVLSTLMSELDRCNEVGADWRKQNYPASINGYGNSYRSFLRSAIADLYSGKLTFGDFAKARDRELTELVNKINIEVQQLQAQRTDAARLQQQEATRQQEQEAKAAEAQRQTEVRIWTEKVEAQRRFAAQQEMQAEESRRQAAMQYLLNQRQAQPYQIQPYQMPIPKTTNCTTFGNQTNCTTR